MKATIMADEDVLSRCAWCGKGIDEEAEVYGFGAKFCQDVDLSEYESQVIELKILTKDRIVPMMITAKGSDAKKAGHDAMFMTCSNECANEMRNALLEETSIGDILRNIDRISN
jgi:endogenous inhibitor of DNA gyrase (YacG/DUF329 family)